MDAPFRIDYARDGGLLRARVTGTNGSFDTTVAFWTEIAAEVRRQQDVHSLLVVDEMLDEPPPPDQLAEFVQRMLGTGLEEVRIAYVEACAYHMPAVEHAEISAVEHGFDVRVFANEVDARLWLRQGPG